MYRFRVFKGVVAVLLAAALIISTGAGIQVHAASYKTGIYKINTQSTPLNIRSCYGSDYMKVGEVPKGTKVNVTFVSANGWGKIVYGSAHGWIALEYCKYVGPAEEPVSSASVNSSKIYGISADNLLWVTGWKQEFSKSSGLCTSSATAALLRRRQAAEGRAVTFIFGDVRAAMGGNPIPDSNGKYESCNSYFSSTTPFSHTNEATGETDTYYLIKETETTHSKNREYLADLLDVHPEGVVIYANYGKSGRHAILISDYVRKSDGSLQFYAYDPANGTGRCKLENTWLMTKISSVGALFSNMISIWYVKGELTVDNDHFKHPEAEVYNDTLAVAKKKTVLYSEPSTGSEQIEKLAKGDIINVSFKISDKEGTLWYITEDGGYILASKTGPAPEVIEEEPAKENKASKSEKNKTEEAVADDDEIEDIDETEAAESVETAAENNSEGPENAAEITESAEEPASSETAETAEQD